MIVGIDEVGRGPWAGPLVVGAVVLNDAHIEGLTDSKLLTKKRRERICHDILFSQASVGLGWVHASELDEIGLSGSLVEATKRALSQITVPYHEIIIDGTINFLKDTQNGQYVTTLKKADLLIPSVSAASIVAKVARDEYMASLDLMYDGYNFTSHSGYGTLKHREAIDKLGITNEHRLSFGPLARFDVDDKKQYKTVSTKQIGDDGENNAANWLSRQGYEVIERNWKTRLCEIDIVVRKDGTYFFVEVKHRKSTEHGGGIAAITPKKLRQMEFAARMYIQYKRLSSSDSQLGVITTIGPSAEFEQYLLLE